jgi:tetratricopeptide (TPR) repeat protein
MDAYYRCWISVVEYKIAMFFLKARIYFVSRVILEDLKNCGDKNVSSKSLQSLGEMYLNQRNYKDALRIYDISIERFRGEIGDGFQCFGAALSLAGYVALVLGDFDKVDCCIKEYDLNNGFEKWVDERIIRLKIERDKISQLSHRPAESSVRS